MRDWSRWTGKNAIYVAALIIIIVLILLAGYAEPVLTGNVSRQPDFPAASYNTTALFSGTTSTSVPTETTIQSTVPTIRAVKVPPILKVTAAPTALPGIVSYPHIMPDTSRGTVTRNYTFRFQDRTISISAVVNRSVYDGAKNGDKSIVMNREDTSRRDWAPGYFRAFVEDPRQEPFYDNLISAFRHVRQEMNLTDDEYLELITVFVQSIPYDEAGAGSLENGNRFPVETFIDGRGVCGDKSMLLAGLLSREGYDTALLVFEPEKHMAVGIRSKEGYRNTSYAYIETTEVSLVGIVPEELTGNISLSSMPYIVQIGNGWKGYTSLSQTRFIIGQYREAETRIRALQEDLKNSSSSPDQFNRDVGEYNQYVMLFNFISTHWYDRPGTYTYVVAHPLPSSSPLVATPSPEPSYSSCKSTGDTSCPAGSLCCGTDNTCYAPCTNGVWDPGQCVCRVSSE